MQTLARLAEEIDEALDEPSLRVLGILIHSLFARARDPGRRHAGR
jgi:hypothetical protein